MAVLHERKIKRANRKTWRGENVKMGDTVGVVKQRESGRNKKVKELTLCVVANHLIMRRGSGATSHVSQQRMMENGWRLHPGPQPFWQPSCQCSTRVVAASDGSVDGSALMEVSTQSKQITCWLCHIYTCGFIKYPECKNFDNINKINDQWRMIYLNKKSVWCTSAQVSAIHLNQTSAQVDIGWSDAENYLTSTDSKNVKFKTEQADLKVKGLLCWTMTCKTACLCNL